MDSILILVLVLVLFKFSKCFSENLENNLNKTQQPLKIQKTPKIQHPPKITNDYGLMYGTTPVTIGSSFDLNYMRYNNKNRLEIPSSKVALDRLMESSSYNCRISDLDNTKSHSDHVLSKIKTENGIRKKPANNVTLRNAVKQS